MLFRSAQNQNELEMIADNLANDKVDTRSIVQVLMSIIDQNINQLISEQRLSKIYLELKAQEISLTKN